MYSWVNNPYYFTGRRLDYETLNYYYRARYYSWRIGRFISADPIGYYDSMNLYQYCGNNPVNFIDPLGLAKYRVYIDRALPPGQHGSKEGIGHVWNELEDDNGNKYNRGGL